MSEWFDSQTKTNGDFGKSLKERIEKANPRRQLTAEETKRLAKLEAITDKLKRGENVLIEVGQNAIKAARSRAIDMSVDAVSQLFVSAGEVIAKRRAALRNPYGRINELWPHNSQKKSKTNSAQRSISDSKLSTSTVDRENSASDPNTRLRIWCPQCSAAYEVPESAMRDHTSVQCSTCKFVWTPSIQRANDSILEGSYYSASKIVTCSRCYQAHSISPKERIATCSRCGAQLDSKNSQS